MTGLDFSWPAVEAARDIAVRADLADRARFVCANVYEATGALGHSTFDVVYVSFGALCWLPSVDRWAEQVGALVAPGGRLYLHDGHPVAWALADDGTVIEYTYFEEAQPFAYDSANTYTDADRPIDSRRSYTWNHGIGETVTSLIRHGLVLDWLVEHDWTVWDRFPWLVRDGEEKRVVPESMPRVPLSFSVLAHRPPGP